MRPRFTPQNKLNATFLLSLGDLEGPRSNLPFSALAVNLTEIIEYTVPAVPYYTIHREKFAQVARIKVRFTDNGRRPRYDGRRPR